MASTEIIKKYIQFFSNKDIWKKVNINVNT